MLFSPIITIINETFEEILNCINCLYPNTFEKQDGQKRPAINAVPTTFSSSDRCKILSKEIIHTPL